MNREAIPTMNLGAVFHSVLKDDLRKWLKEIAKEIGYEENFDHLTKYELIDLVLEMCANEKYNEIIHERIKREFPTSCGIGPSNTEKILECTTSERKRWRSEGKLIVVDEFNSGTKRFPVWVPMFCRTQLESITEEEIQKWRDDWEEEKKKKRKLKEEYQKINPKYFVFQASKKDYREFAKGPIAFYDEKELKGLIKELTEQAKSRFKDNFYVIVKDYYDNEILHIKKVR